MIHNVIHISKHRTGISTITWEVCRLINFSFILQDGNPGSGELELHIQGVLAEKDAWKGAVWKVCARDGIPSHENAACSPGIFSRAKGRLKAAEGCLLQLCACQAQVVTNIPF